MIYYNIIKEIMNFIDSKKIIIILTISNNNNSNNKMYNLNKFLKALYL